MAYVLYALLQRDSVTVGLSGAPSVTYRRLRQQDPGGRLILLSYPLPLWIGERVVQDLLGVLDGGHGGRRRLLALWSLRFHTYRSLQRFGERACWRPVTDDGPSGPQPDAEEVDAASRLLSGRVLLEEEVKRLFDEEGEALFSSQFTDLVEELVLAGRMIRLAALAQDATGRWHCRRCGSYDQVDVGPCELCGREACASCTECAPLGIARSCAALFVKEWDGQPHEEAFPADKPLLHMPFRLSPAQERAARAVAADKGKRAIIWAACGAGKTEVVYRAIEQTLQRGQPVLLAVPRRDVAQELGERLQAVFPGVSVKVLYGGVARRFADAQLVVATTHQVMRFYRRFALVVLDEVDAFPYRGNPMLRRAVERAVARDGRLIYMTATPTEALLRRAESAGWSLITIPARHHGYPLPVPELVKCPGLSRTLSDISRDRPAPAIPKTLAELVQQCLRTQKPLLVFVPTVRLVEPTVRLLDRVCRSGAKPAADALPLVYGIHARHPHRTEIRKAFGRGEFPVLVSTTVLERGITIPGVNVIVLWADHEKTFDAPTLIQMAGRVGRTAEHPTGEVYFVGVRISVPMRSAQARIRQLNDEAQRAGFLHESGNGRSEGVS